MQDPDRDGGESQPEVLGRELLVGDRVAIIGCGGSGKTIMAHRLARLTGAPLTHLDTIYYDSEWNSLPTAEFAERQGALVRQDRWIIEGNYASTLPIRLARATTVIFLDIHPIVCLVGILQRRLRYHGGQDAESGVYDRVTLQFVRYVLGYRRSMRPRIRALLQQNEQSVHVVTLTSRPAASAFLTELQSTPRSGRTRLP